MQSVVLTSPRLYQQAADRISELIRRGEYPPGAKLPAERDLAKQLGVSRPTVREALIALELAGQVEVRVGSGAYVRAPEAAAARDAGTSAFELIAARRLIEPQVAATAAQSASERDVERIFETLDLVARHTTYQVERIEADHLFHRSIAEATHNAVLIDVIDALWKEMFGPVFKLLAERTRVTDRPDRTLHEHEAIFRAIQRRDPAAAHAAMVTHLVNVELELMQGDDSAAS